MKYAAVFIISWILTGSLLGQTGSGNAFNKVSTFGSNAAVINGNFKFDILVNGHVNYMGKSYDFYYFINSRDGSMFFGPGLSSAITRAIYSGRYNKDDIFQGAIIHPGGISVQYWENQEDGERNAYGITFAAFANNTEPGALRNFLRNARKSAGPDHPRFGPTTVYQTNMGGHSIKMTITNRGLSIPISPAAVGMMTAYFKDSNQHINRLVTKFEMPGLTVSLSNFRQGSQMAEFEGYENKTGRINLQAIPSRRPDREDDIDPATREAILQELADLQKQVDELRQEKQDNCTITDDPLCEANYDAWILQYDNKIKKIYRENPWSVPVPTSTSR